MESMSLEKLTWALAKDIVQGRVDVIPGILYPRKTSDYNIRQGFRNE